MGGRKTLGQMSIPSLAVGGREAVIGTECPPYQRNAGAVGQVMAGGRIEDGQMRRTPRRQPSDVASPQRGGAADGDRGNCFVDGHAHVTHRQAMQNESEVV